MVEWTLSYSWSVSVESNDGISKDIKIFLHTKMFTGRNDDRNKGTRKGNNTRSLTPYVKISSKWIMLTGTNSKTIKCKCKF